MIAGYRAAKEKGEEEERRWASQHLNIEIGLALQSDNWVGAEFWDIAPERVVSLDELKASCDVIVERENSLSPAVFFQSSGLRGFSTEFVSDCNYVAFR